MATNNQKFRCPKCRESISIDDALMQQIEEKIKKDFAIEQKAKEAELQTKERQLTEALKSAEVEVNKKVAEKIAAEKVILWKKALVEAEKSKSAEVKMLEEQLKDKNQKLSEANAEALKLRLDKKDFEEEKRNFELEKIRQIEAERKQIEDAAIVKFGQDNKKLQEQLEMIKKERETDIKLMEEKIKDSEVRLEDARKNEIELRKEKNRLAQEKKDFELEKQRQLDKERKKIEEGASKKAAEAEQYKIAQLEKKLSDALKVNEEQKRKLEQGSQQTQGEILELGLEELLRNEFPQDEIIPVPKGVGGADIIQKVFTYSGIACGQIVWESKKTKNWVEGWVQKLKDDQRTIKANLAVIVSAVLPEDVKGFALRDGVWVCDIKLITALATALRINLESVTRERAMSVGKNEKMEVLYTYLTGVEFKQRVEAIVEAFSNMDEGLKKERMAYEKIWSEREKQIKKVITNTVGMYGDLSGLVALPQIKRLELEEGGDTNSK
ncbi:MAG: DUF2130 domain-containing protein [Candidatus Terrybacteria bacterium]|nr:DUF2130 domain-containing protein [Candidatus Terrybacteria bacterium]